MTSPTSKQERQGPLPKSLQNLKRSGENQTSSWKVLRQLWDTHVITETQLESAIQACSQKGESVAKQTKKTKGNKESLPRRQRHVALRFFYDGATFSGLAQNVGVDTDRSIERALFEALSKSNLITSREACGFSRCGRTDKGVSAAGQVVALQLHSAFSLTASRDQGGTSPLTNDELPTNDTESMKIWDLPSKKAKSKNADGTKQQEEPVEKELTEYAYGKILNNLLPREIRILGWAPVSDDFSARFSATTRTYRYFFWKDHHTMDLDRIRQGLSLMIGSHDFRNFCKMDVEKVYNFVRTIHEADIVELTTNHEDHASGGCCCCYLQIKGQAFLWHQIRCITEVLFMIGRGLEEPSVVTELLNVTKYPGKPSYALADEKPLVLHECGYPNLSMGYSAQNLWNVNCQWQTQWEELSLSAARIRNGIASLDHLTVLREDLVTFATSKLVDRHKKRRKAGLVNDSVPLPTPFTVEDLPPVSSSDGTATTSSNTIVWGEALHWLQTQGLIPGANGLTKSVHVPLLKRCMGTTYEEKIEALQKNEKRRIKYEENVTKKRKTKEEDAAFYAHKTKQGGSGFKM